MVPLIDKLILIVCCTMDSHTMGCLDRANSNQLYCMMKCLQFVSKTSPSGQDYTGSGTSQPGYQRHG